LLRLRLFKIGAKGGLTSLNPLHQFKKPAKPYVAHQFVVLVLAANHRMGRSEHERIQTPQNPVCNPQISVQHGLFSVSDSVAASLHRARLANQPIRILLGGDEVFQISIIPAILI
jgi:hypothetical protein